MTYLPHLRAVRKKIKNTADALRKHFLEIDDPSESKRKLLATVGSPVDHIACSPRLEIGTLIQVQRYYPEHPEPESSYQN